ncbi:MAG TPA: hypothetical protein VNG51_10485 [Ktedonobacteraceae bacterium]|nr:hypothetical protein [Ktedonobacteraceae bacterium]
MSTIQTNRNTQKILARTKGLRQQLQPGEEPLLKIPAIWDNGQTHHSKPCDVIVTNMRLIGFELVTFPRERLFLEDFPLASLRSITLRHKTYEPLFRELAISDGKRKVLIRAPRKHIENLYTALRSTIEQYTPTTHPDFADEQANVVENTQPTTPATVYGRQDIRATFEHSPLAIVLLFVGGLVLELIGVAGWLLTGNIQVGIPLFVAGFLAVIVATLVRRQRG